MVADFEYNSGFELLAERLSNNQEARQNRHPQRSASHASSNCRIQQFRRLWRSILQWFSHGGSRSCNTASWNTSKEGGQPCASRHVALRK